MSKTTQKHYVLALVLGAVSLFTSSANAELSRNPDGSIYGEFTVQGQFVVERTVTGQHGTLTFDLTDYEIDTNLDSFKFSFSSFLETQFRFQASKPDVTAPAGTYKGDLTYNLDVTSNGFNLGSTQKTTKQASYILEDDLYFPEVGDLMQTPSAETDISYFDWSVSTNINQLLNENNQIIIKFDFAGPNVRITSGAPIDFSHNFNTSIITKPLEAFGEVKFYATVAPEPASFLIFGTVLLFGLPFIQHLRRKNQGNEGIM